MLKILNHKLNVSVQLIRHQQPAIGKHVKILHFHLQTIATHKEVSNSIP